MEGTSASRLDELEATIARLEKINRVLMARVERGTDVASGDYSLFLAATVLEQKVAERTREVETAMHDLAISNQELSAAKDRAEEAVRSKDAFLAGMSHELRTPLNSMLGHTETLLDEIFGEIGMRQRASLMQIDTSGRHLLALINDILDLAKAGAGEAALHPEEIDLREVCESSLATMSVEAMKKDHRLSFQMEPKSLELNADPRRMKQILLNLVGNAIKYTPPGGEVRLRVRGEPAAGCVRIAVTDTGIGISAEDRQRLFQPFVQLDSGLSRSYGGTGLGLSLAREMVELHGGSIDVESEPGSGSTFTVTLPWTPEAGAADSAGGAELGVEALQDDVVVEAAPTVLLAEDNEANIGMIKPYLEAHGFRVVTAMDGASAVEGALWASPT